MPHVHIYLFENNSRHQLWGDAKVYADDGIRYSMRIKKKGFTNHIPGPIPLPDFKESNASDSSVRSRGYRMLLIDGDDAKEIEVDEDWLNEVLGRILLDYSTNMKRLTNSSQQEP